MLFLRCHKEMNTFVDVPTRAIFEIFVSAIIKKPAGCFRLNNFTLLAVKLKVFVSSGSFGILSIVLSSNTLLAPLLLESVECYLQKGRLGEMRR